MGVNYTEEGRQTQRLIPGLPDDIGLECLVRVPYESHSTLKFVCRGWRALISHPSFFEHRRKARTAEQLVCPVQLLPTPLQRSDHFFSEDVGANERDEAKQRVPLYQYGLSVYNATYQTWHQMMPNSIPMFCHCLALPSSGKLLLLGGWDPIHLDPVPDVYVVDLIGGNGGRWRRAAPMSVARSFFACAAVGPSTVYVAGGHDSQKNAMRSAEVYDVEVDEWRTLPSMWEERDECQGLSWEGDSRFWVVSGYSTESQGRFRSDAECYDPTTGRWSKVEGIWSFPTSSPRGSASVKMVSSRGQPNYQLYHHHQQQQQIGIGEIREYDREGERWRVVSSISLPQSESGLRKSSKCVIRLGGDGDANTRMLVMGNGGDGTVGAFILERNDKGNTKWTHVRVPLQFSGFPYSASHLLI